MGLADVNQYNYQRIHDDKLRESICVAATVQVTSFDPAKMTVNVQPLSKHLENGKYESQPPILKVPVALTHCGGFIFRPWIKEGDIGTVVYLDHDMDATVTGGKEAKPLTERNHATTDAIFVGALVSTPVRFCSFSPNRECRKMAGKGVQPLNNYTCRFRPSSLKCTDKSGLDGLQAGK